MANTAEETIVRTKNKEKTRKPPRWNVIFLNDEKTTMEWVVAMLVKVFNHPVPRAASITLDVHTKGSAVAGTYTHEVAEQKAFETVAQSRDNGFPLRVKIEPEE